MPKKDKEFYDKEGNQILPLPDKWMLPAAYFSVGQKIVADLSHYCGGGKNVVVEVIKIHAGYGFWPPGKFEGEQVGQQEGCLVVRLPFTLGNKRVGGERLPVDTIVLNPSDEGKNWRIQG